MDTDKIFKDLRQFQWFPNYQLERRLDIFLLAYMPGILDEEIRKKEFAKAMVSGNISKCEN